MPPEQRRMIFLLAIAAAVVLVIVGILYYEGHFIPSGVHHKHAYLAWALAIGAVIVANFNRPVASAASRR